MMRATRTIIDNIRLKIKAFYWEMIRPESSPRTAEQAQERQDKYTNYWKNDLGPDELKQLLRPFTANVDLRYDKEAALALFKEILRDIHKGYTVSVLLNDTDVSIRLHNGKIVVKRSEDEQGN